MVCLFILLTVVLEEQTFLILVKSNLSTVSFMDHAFSILRHLYLIQDHKDFLLCLLLEFLASSFIFKAVIHFIKDNVPLC